MRDFILFTRHFCQLLAIVGNVLLALLGLMAMLAGVIALAEGMNYWDALYFAFVTGLTIGYGDITPVTFVGRTVSIFIGLLGVVFFGIVVGVATRALVHCIEEKRGIKH